MAMNDRVDGLLGAPMMANVTDLMAQPLEDNLWLFGVLLAVFGTLVGTIGKQMIRRSEMYKQDRKERESHILFVVGRNLNPLFLIRLIRLIT